MCLCVIPVIVLLLLICGVFFFFLARFGKKGLGLHIERVRGVSKRVNFFMQVPLLRFPSEEKKKERKRKSILLTQ